MWDCKESIKNNNHNIRKNKLPDGIGSGGNGDFLTLTCTVGMGDGTDGFGDLTSFAKPPTSSSWLTGVRSCRWVGAGWKYKIENLE